MTWLYLNFENSLFNILFINGGDKALKNEIELLKFSLIYNNYYNNVVL